MFQDFQVGDIVMLRSGGPKMTVTGAIGTLCSCEWFVGKYCKSRDFHCDTLFRPRKPNARMREQEKAK